MSALTLGSLFDGSGGFPLAAKMVGIKPMWASEVDPFAIRVTRKNLPEVRHVGDINLLDGGRLQPVDVITFGSPCQDLSIAGKRSGIDGSRSSLFYQAVRIIEEMRQATHGAYPRYAVWENVPGVFSSNHGADFAAVLQAFIEVSCQQTPCIPVPETSWATSGYVLADGTSLAWRVLDAQFFGVPQRRRRIFLVADFAGQSAPEILFEPQSSTRNPDASKEEKQNPARAINPSTTGNQCGALTLRMRAGKPGGGKGPLIQHDLSGTLGTGADQVLFEPSMQVMLDYHPNDSRIEIGDQVTSQTLTSRMGTGGGNVPLLLDQPVYGINSVHDNRKYGGECGYETTVAKTLDLAGGNPACNQGGMVILEPIYASSKSDHFTRATTNVSGALLASDSHQPPIVANTMLRPRKLTPLECSRLQGFPDYWCDNLTNVDPDEDEIRYWEGVWKNWNLGRGVKPKTRSQITTWLKTAPTDSAQYKLWGNGVALPVVKYVLNRLQKAANTTG